MRFRDTLGISALVTEFQHIMILEIEAKMKPIGLTFPQYSVLSILEDQESLTNADLARRCSVTPQTMNRMLQVLLRRGLVKNEQDPKHALKLLFKLTVKAEKLICKTHIIVNDVEKNFIKALSPKEYNTFKDILNKCMTTEVTRKL